MSYNQPRSGWELIEDAALDASYPEPGELDRNLGTPYIQCTTCNKRQEADFALDGSGIPYCTICGTLYPGLTVQWEEPEPEPLTQQERRLLSKIIDAYDKVVVAAADGKELTTEEVQAMDRQLQSIFEKLKLS